MKKIGILTYMQSNYGAVLQAYALQKYLRMNCDDAVEIINFTTEQHIKEDKIFRRRSPNFVKNFILSLRAAIYYRALRRRKKRTIKFKKENINFSRRYKTTEELLKNPPQKDIYIAGSDQVFNLNTPFGDVYYLGFKKNGGKKIAYAASFGVSKFDDKYHEKGKSFFPDFDVISCREKVGADFISNIIGKEVPVVIDPTLLLTAEDWSNVMVKPDFSNYICIYDLNGNSRLIEYAKTIQSKTGLKIACITSNIRKRYNVDKVIYDAGPAEFVGLIACSNYTITDSFHGTVFSLIFNRPFNSYIANTNLSSRIYNLLDSLGLSRRIIKDGDAIDFNKDYMESPNADLQRYALSSYQFIKDNIINI